MPGVKKQVLISEENSVTAVIDAKADNFFDVNIVVFVCASTVIVCMRVSARVCV